MSFYPKYFDPCMAEMLPFEPVDMGDLFYLIHYTILHL